MLGIQSDRVLCLCRKSHFAMTVAWRREGCINTNFEVTDFREIARQICSVRFGRHSVHWRRYAGRWNIIVNGDSKGIYKRTLAVNFGGTMLSNPGRGNDKAWNWKFGYLCSLLCFKSFPYLFRKQWQKYIAFPLVTEVWEVIYQFLITLFSISWDMRMVIQVILLGIYGVGQR
jgi:hypothetical protein